MSECELGEDTKERRQNAAQILNIVNPTVRNKSLFIGDYDESSNSGSDIEMPFSDDEEKTVEFYKRRKRMSKFDAGIYLMSTFSKEYKQIEDELRREMCKNGQDNVCTENLDKFEISKADDSDFEEFTKHAQDILSQSGLDELERQREKENPKKLRNEKTKPVKKIEDEEEFETNTLSGVWHMLDGQSMKNGFPITQNGYNFLNDKRLDWLKREDTPWEEKENVKKKCEQWLKTCKLPM